MRRLLFPLLLLLIIGASCEKRTDVISTNTEYQSYSRLDSGSYWIYEHYRRDANGNATSTGVFDSCYVEKDTMARGERWAKYVDPYPSVGYTLMRDSLWFIVDYSGQIQFAARDTTTVFSRRAIADPDHMLSDADTFAVVERKGAGRVAVEVPAGLFPTLGFRQIYTVTLPPQGTPKVRTLYTRYSEYAGKVWEDLPFFTTSAETEERRLLRFKVRPIPVE